MHFQAPLPAMVASAAVPPDMMTVTMFLRLLVHKKQGPRSYLLPWKRSQARFPGVAHTESPN